MELNPDALKRAAELDAERKHALGNGFMFGLPVLLKDNIAYLPVMTSRDNPTV